MIALPRNIKQKQKKSGWEIKQSDTEGIECFTPNSNCKLTIKYHMCMDDTIRLFVRMLPNDSRLSRVPDQVFKSFYLGQHDASIAISLTNRVEGNVIITHIEAPTRSFDFVALDDQMERVVLLYAKGAEGLQELTEVYSVTYDELLARVGHNQMKKAC